MGGGGGGGGGGVCVQFIIMSVVSEGNNYTDVYVCRSHGPCTHRPRYPVGMCSLCTPWLCACHVTLVYCPRHPPAVCVCVRACIHTHTRKHVSVCASFLVMYDCICYFKTPQTYRRREGGGGGGSPYYYI